MLGRGQEDEMTRITGLDVVATGTIQKKNKNDFEEWLHCFHIENFRTLCVGQHTQLKRKTPFQKKHLFLITLGSNNK